MKTTRARAGRLVGLTFTVAACLAASSALAAPGDPIGGITNVALGGVNDHNPYFKDYNAPRGMVTLTGGNVVVAWSARDDTSPPNPTPDSPDGTNGADDGAFFRILNPSGAFIAPVTRPYLDINAAGTGAQRTAMLASLSGGGFVMVWSSFGGPTDLGSGEDTFGRVFSATGAAVSGTFKVNDLSTSDEETPSGVIGLTGGGFAVVWKNESNDSGNTDDFFIRVYNAAGAPQAASTQLGGVAQDGFFKDFDAFSSTDGLVALSNGNVAVSWGVRDTSFDGTGTGAEGPSPGGWAGLVQVFNASGAAVSGIITPYIDINADRSGHQFQPRLAALSGGGFTAVWNSARNTNDGGNSDIGDGGAPPANQTSGGDTYTRVFDNSGAGVSTTVRVNDTTTDDFEEPMAVVALTGGGYAVVWRDGDDISGANTDTHYVRAYSAAGAAAGASVQIAGAASLNLFEDFHGSRGLVALGDGGFAVGLRVRSSNGDGTGTSVDGGGFAAAVRVLNANGTNRQGPFFPYLDINANGSGHQNIPQLAQVTGGFAVSWNSASNSDDGANSDVFVGFSATNGGDTWTRLYANTGIASHATVRVHNIEPTGVNDQQDPSSLVRAGANYLVLIRDDNANTALSGTAESNKDDLFIRAFGDAVVTAPEIVVEQAATNIADGGSQSFGSVNVGSNTSLVFTIRNSGTADLTGLVITKDGTHQADYTITANPTSPVTPAGSTTFTVQFAPGAAGARTAAIHIASNDADENPFDINLSGTGVALPVLSINDVGVTEGNAGTVTATFTVSLNVPALPGGVSFDIATQNSTATAGSDYVTNILTGQTIPAGSSSYSFAVTVNGDAIDEANEAFFVNVTNVTGATVGDSQGLGTITDNDTAGITVTPTSGLVTTEAGAGTATFTVVLNSQPTADVTIGLSSSDTTEGTVAPASLLFTSGNWNVARTVTVTGVDDAIDDGDIAYSILTAAATGAGSGYAGIDAADVSVSNTDNDAAGITVTPTAGLATTEAGAGTATFTVVLNSQPTADVTIGLSSSDTTEGTVAPASLVFTNGNWNVAQTVTVTGVDDAIDDGDVAYTILTAAATGAGSGYAGIDAADVSVSNTDDDAAGITVTPTAGLITTEAGGTATFTVVLESEPTADVTIGLSSDNTAEGTVAPASLVFTNGNWNVAQTVTVTGFDDAIDDGDIAYTILTAAATGAGSGYVGVDATDVSVSNTDDDAAGITVTPTAGLITTEAGGTASFTVVLESEPTADVTIGLSSDNTSEGTVAPASLVFTNGNWNVAQTVTVTGVDDAIDDGDIGYTILTAAATGAGSGYAGIDAADVSASNTDDDAAGVTVTPIAGLITTEAGGTATFTVVLDSEPTADVTIGLSSDNTNEGTVAPASLLFTSGNWNVAQIVTITGVDDSVDDGDIAYTILTAAATGAGSGYAGLDGADVAASNTDDDSVGIVVAPTVGLSTTEAGDTAIFTVVLNSEPLADVTIGLSSSDTTEGTVAPASLNFTSGNWNVAQSVTVSGVDDAVDDGDIAFTVLTGPAASGDAAYAGLDAADVALSNIDDDGAGVLVTPTAGLITTEAGGTATFSVVLTSQPTADVVIDLSSSDTTEGTVAPAALTFTSADWNVARTVTVTGVDDAVDDGDLSYSIVTSAAISGDPNYGGVNPPDVVVTNADDDTAAILVAPTVGLGTTEAGGTATFTVVLSSEPLGAVTIGLSSSDTTEGTVGPASLTFTVVDWNVPRTVTVSGVDDALDDGDIAYTVLTAAATSSDAGYAGIDAADVVLSNTDDDGAGILVSPTAGLVTTEAAGTATFTVVLSSQPTVDVSIGLSSSDTTEGTVAPASLTFTTANWNVPRTVTATGVDDALDDGDVAYTITTAAAVSADSSYGGVNPPDVQATNTDDDGAGILVTPLSGLVTTEAGGTATFTIALASQPTADVTIGLSSSDTTEGTVSPAQVVFTGANWNDAQIVTLTGVDDVSLDGDIAYNAVRAPATSADPVYQGMAGGNVAATNNDNDTNRMDGTTATGSGPSSLLITGGGCSLDLSQSAFMTTIGLRLPPLVQFPHGAIRFRAHGCQPGASLQVSITWPPLAANPQHWKLSSTAPALPLQSALTAADTLSYTIVDGGPFDADGVVNGVIVDPVAVGFGGGVTEPQQIPASGPASQLALLLLFGLIGGFFLRRRV